jgi:hypothetical protein
VTAIVCIPDMSVDADVNPDIETAVPGMGQA